MAKHVAIVGATGAVGREFLNVLGRRRFPLERLTLLASGRSAGQEIEWVHGALPVQELTPDSFKGVDLALFSAGASVSREFAPIARDHGTVVVDNSSAFRLDPTTPLVVPEVNPQAVKHHYGVLANPNCSTIILAVALWPLHRENRIRRAVVATYQAASGAGARALDELRDQTRIVLDGGLPAPEVFDEPCAFNVFSHNSPIGEDGYNIEETKMVWETRRIFEEPHFQVTATCMRVPVMRAHTEAIAIEFENPITLHWAYEQLRQAPGLMLVDDRDANDFPTPLKATEVDEVLVGRVRLDPTAPDHRGLQLICAGDQLRKGAALNAVQIAELLG